MKWFKHITNSRNDPDISDSYDRFGDAGPRIFWDTLEIFYSEYRGDEVVVFSKQFLRRQLKKNWRKTEEIWNFFQRKSRLFYKVSGEKVELTIPKAIELADEWTKRLRRDSGVAPKKLHHEVEVEGEGDIDKENKQSRRSKPCLPKRAAPAKGGDSSSNGYIFKGYNLYVSKKQHSLLSQAYPPRFLLSEYPLIDMGIAEKLPLKAGTEERERRFVAHWIQHSWRRAVRKEEWEESEAKPETINRIMEFLGGGNRGKV